MGWIHYIKPNVYTTRLSKVSYFMGSSRGGILLTESYNIKYMDSSKFQLISIRLK